MALSVISVVAVGAVVVVRKKKETTESTETATESHGVSLKQAAHVHGSAAPSFTQESVRIRSCFSVKIRGLLLLFRG